MDLLLLGYAVGIQIALLILGIWRKAVIPLMFSLIAGLVVFMNIPLSLMPATLFGFPTVDALLILYALVCMHAVTLGDSEKKKIGAHA